MKSSFKLLASLLFMAFAVNASALGLGEITAESALNEPLVAKIKLLNAESLTNNDVIVALGSQEDYEIAGVEREYSHTDFIFEPRLDGEAEPYIYLKSSRAITEPYLNFVVQVRWPQGKLLREYTILIDFPVFTGATENRPVAAATTQPARVTTTPSTRPSTQSEASNISLPSDSTNTSQRTLVAGSGEYYVQSGDTLWGVAGSLARSTGTTRNQAMLSIRDQNPEAFINGDLNALKSGVLLKMPNQQQIVQRSASEAASEFASRLQTGSRPVEATPIQNRDSNFRSQSASNSSEGGRLALASVAAIGSSIGANSAGAEDNELTGVLADENNVLKEELDKVSLENTDLKDRIAALEEQLELSQDVIQIQSDELAIAQQVAEQINESSIDEPTVASIEPEIDSEVAEALAPKPQVIQPQPVQEASFLDTAIGFLPFVGAFFIVLLLVLFLILKRRKSQEEELMPAEEAGSDYELDHIDQDLSIDSSIEDEMQSTRSFKVDQEDDLDDMDTLFSEDDEESGSIEDIEDAAEAERQNMEDTLSNFESTNIMSAQSDESSSEELDSFNETQSTEVNEPDADSLDELDEFADLDSFFNDDDIEDFDPDALDDNDLDDSASSGDDNSLNQNLSEDANALEGTDQAFSDNDEKMEFESFEIPSDSSSESIAQASLDHENSMDFEVGIELPGQEEPIDNSVLEVDLNDSERSMDFDLDDVDPISEDDEIVPVDSGDEDSSGMDFDLSGIDLGIDEEADNETLDIEDDNSLDFDELGSIGLDTDDSSFDDEKSDELEIDGFDLESMDEDLESSMDDLLNDMNESAEIEISSDDEITGLDEFDLDDDLLGDLSAESGADDSGLEEEIATKLELADAYADMGDARGAQELIEEILADGNESQKVDARLIADKIEGLV